MSQRFAVILLLFILAVMSVSCGKRTVPPLEPLQGEVTDLANIFVGKLVAGDYDGAVGFFDNTMKKALPEKKLTETWQGLLLQVGAFDGEIGNRLEKIQGYDVVFVTTQFEKELIDIRVVFNSDRRIAGLFFEPAQGSGYTVPPYANPELFTEREVKVGSGEWELPGTLTMPAGSGPFAVVVLVHGSGPNDRDETIGPNKPFKDLAWGLASRGIAVLRYEKRTREHQQKMAALQDTITVQEETIDDALAAVALLKNNNAVNPDRIFILGHSLGGMLAPRTAAADNDIAGLIIFAGATRPLEDLILEQVTYLSSLDGTISAEESAELRKIELQATNVKDPNLSLSTPAVDLPLGIPAAYWLDLRGYNPAETAKTFTIPILILQGERDYQVTMVDFSIWQETLASSEDVELKSYPNLNHLFIPGEGPGNPEEYRRPGNVSQNVINDIADWLGRN